MSSKRVFRIGIIGYTDDKKIDSILRCRESVETHVVFAHSIVYSALKKKHGFFNRFEDVSGIMPSGTASIAYDFFGYYDPDKEKHVKNVAFACSKANACDLNYVDELRIIGDEIGDEKHQFLDYIDALIRVGDCVIAIDYAEEFKKLYPEKPIQEYGDEKIIAMVMMKEEHRKNAKPPDMWDIADAALMEAKKYVPPVYTETHEQRIKIGISSYSRSSFSSTNVGFNIFLGLQNIKHTYETELKKKIKVSIVSGLVDLDIPHDVYRSGICTFGQDTDTVGIACEKAKDFPQFPVDEKHIIGKNWGDETDFFLEYIDCLIRVDDHEHSLREANLFKERYPNKILLEYTSK